MKEKIRKISMGYIDTEIPSVSLNPININETIMSGTSRKAEIHITSDNRLSIRGFIYSSNPNVVLSSDNILGVFIHVSYMINAEKLGPGEIIDGNFVIVSNAGEFVIPYSFIVLEKNSDGLDISSVDGFYKLYLKDPFKAKELFLSDEFIHAPFMLEAKTRSFYDGLKNSNNVDNAIAQFFKALGFNIYDEQVDSIVSIVDPINDKIPNVDRMLLKSEILFDHAKLNFETNEILRGAALSQMQKVFKDLKSLGAPIDVMKLHKAEISYYKKQVRLKPANVDRLSAYKYLQNCFERGCRSPYLYLEVCKAFNEHPELLRDYNELTLQAINFGSRHGYLSDELASKIAIHAQSVKTIPCILLNSMKRIYRYYPSIELLTGIVSSLVKNEKVSQDAFKWYLKAIKENVKISKLFDYFIESVPQAYDEKLPNEVYLYYSYNPPSTDKGMKTLYSSIVKFFDKSSSIYQSYEMQIRRFVTNNLTNGVIDRKLALIYQDYIYPEMIDSKIAKIIPDVLLTCEVIIFKSGFSNLIVLYDEFEGEQIASINEGIARLALYTPNYHFLLEDINGDRYFVDKIQVNKLIKVKDDLLNVCQNFQSDMPLFRILEADKLLGKTRLNEEEVIRLNSLAKSDGIHPLYKTKIHNAICNNFDWRNNKNLSDILLSCIDDEFMNSQDKAKLSDALIEIDKSSEAESLIKNIGFSKLDFDKLLELCKEYIRTEKDESNNEITGQCFYLFKSGKYNNDTLSYLCKNFNGLCLDMANILFLSISEGADTFDMAERILAQMLFTNQYKDIDEIFRTYIKTGKVDKVITIAYFVVKSYRYFINGEDIDPQIFESIKNIQLNQLASGSAPLITRLAISKYFSNMESLSVEDANLCKEIVSGLVAKGAIFPYLKKLSNLISLPEEVKDKTIVTYHANEGDSVALILVPEDDDEEPIYLEMNYVCLGLFVKPVLLFEGEYQTYQIRVTKDGLSTITQEGELKSDISYCDEDRKFIRLNILLHDSDNPSDEKWQKDMAAYSFDNAINKLLFSN